MLELERELWMFTQKSKNLDTQKDQLSHSHRNEIYCGLRCIYIQPMWIRYIKHKLKLYIQLFIFLFFEKK